jgi:molybdopterin converting factor small subunit
MKRRVELYGRLRDAGLGQSVVLDLPADATARRALAALKLSLGRRGSLLDGCALASHDTVLTLNDVLPKKGPLAVLPPVCGG